MRSFARVHARDRLGRIGEGLAAAHFQWLGFRVLARNARTREGELDLIVFDGETLVFADAIDRFGPYRDGIASYTGPVLCRLVRRAQQGAHERFR